MVHALTERKRLFILILASTIVLYFIFAPAVSILYYAGDDYRYAFGAWSKACRSDDGFEFMLTLGRPLQAYLDCLNYKFAYTFERMHYLRLFSVVMMGCTMGLLIDWLLTLGILPLAAFFAAGAFCLVPAMYGDAILTGSQPLPFAVLLTLIAYGCLNKVQHQGPQKKWFLLSAFFIAASLLTYPAMAFFFATLILTKVLFSNVSEWPIIRRQIAIEAGLFCTLCMLYFVYAYINMRYFPQAPVTDTAYQVNHANLNLLEIVGRGAWIANVFNTWWAFSTLNNMTVQGWLVISIFLGGLSLGVLKFLTSQFYMQHKTRAFTYLIQMVISVIFLTGLSCAFVLLMPSRSFPSRLYTGVIAAGLALLFWALHQWQYLSPVKFRNALLATVVGLFFIVQGYHTNITLTAYAFSYNQFLNIVKTQISTYLAKGDKLNRIHYIVPQQEYPYNKFFLSNGALMQLLGKGQYQLQWCSLSRGTPGKEQDHQQEMLACLAQLPMNGIAVTYTKPGETFKPSDNMLLIDMQNVTVRDLYKEYLKNYYNIKIAS